MKVNQVVRNRKGQSTIEFVLAMVLLLAFVLFMFQLSMVFGFGNFVHYATFMSARAYLAAGASQEDQQERAKRVIVLMLKKSEGQAGVDRFPTISKGEGEGDLRGFSMDSSLTSNQDYSWMKGVRYKFKSRLFVIPLAGFGRKSDSENSLTLTSESWLGREPAEDECIHAMGRPYFVDNGC